MLPEIKDSFVKYLFSLEDLRTIFIPERFTQVAIDREVGIYGIYGQHVDTPGTPTPVALIFTDGWTEERIDEWLRSHSTYIPEKPQNVPLKEGRNPLLMLMKAKQHGKLRKTPTLRSARQPSKRRRQPPAPAFSLVQRNVPHTNRKLVGDTIFLADSWHGLLGPTQEWIPRAAIESPRQKRRWDK